VLTFVGPGKKGREVRARFEAPPYGWPRDAVGGSLLALLSAGILRAASNGTSVTAREVDQGKIGAADFRAENVVPTAVQRIAVRKLFAAAGIDPRSKEEALSAPLFVSKVFDLAEKAGGDAPLPERPDTRHLLDLRAKAGNELLVGLYEALERLRKEITEWTELGEKTHLRQPTWQRLRRLLDHARDLPEASSLRQQADAVERERALLEDPDSVSPLLAETTDVLRKAMTEAHERYEGAFDAGLRELDESKAWREIEAGDRERLLRENGLMRRGRPRLDTDGAILDGLDTVSLSEWTNLSYALSARFAQALQQAAKLLEPKAVPVSPPHANLKTEAEVDEYLGRLRSRIMGHIKDGRPVVL
ncbi:MAG: hypothetical protein M3P49_16545, partial [Actinomycetota bacterium]|nr:hypothetical protein [Actinomycetota bacterium]